MRSTPSWLTATALLAAALLAAGLAGCAGSTVSPATVSAGATVDATTSTDTSANDAATIDLASPADVEGVCPPQEVACADNQIQDLSLFKKVNPAAVASESDGSGWISTLDATGGGMSPTQSFLYAKFTANGLEKVNVGDQAALESADWDIAFRRYVIRLNSGVAGPSCVQGGEIKGKTFTEVDAWPATIKLASEAYYDAECTLVEDSSGLPNAPATVLAKFWTYKSCVQMTGKTWGLQLADGQRVKLTVDGYYAAAAQDTCNATGAAPQGSVGGKFRLRWAFLP
jgi:hypothetical protein